MKKLFLISLLFSYFSYSSENSNPRPEQQWRKNFKQLQNKESDQYQNAVTRWQQLGYNPDITLLEKDNPSIEQKHGPTLFIHGWGSSKDAYSVNKLCKSDNIPGDVITFNFPDASSWIFNTIPYWMPITKSSFVGKSDIVALLAVLKTLHETACLPAIWYAHSRGGGVMQAVIGILNQPEDNEKSVLKECGLKKQHRAEILASIKILYLLNPLTNIDKALNKQIQTKIGLLDYIPWLREKVLFPWLKNNILPRLTCYNPEQKNPINYLSQWQGLKGQGFNLWLHFEENDCDVSNDDDLTLIYTLATYFGDLLYFSRTNNGGHNAYEILINQIVHIFNSKQDCAGDKNKKINAFSWKIVEEAQMYQPVVGAHYHISTHLGGFSAKYTQKTFWRHRMTQRLKSIFVFIGILYILYRLNNSPYGIVGFHFDLNLRYFSVY